MTSGRGHVIEELMDAAPVPPHDRRHFRSHNPSGSPPRMQSTKSWILAKSLWRRGASPVVIHRRR
jgi:hypothetical protein